jgi:hypothetical protein
MTEQGGGYIEIKGTQKRLGLTDVRGIFKSGSRDALVTCGSFTPGAKKYMQQNNKTYVENVPLDEVMDYDMSQEYD